MNVKLYNDTGDEISVPPDSADYLVSKGWSRNPKPKTRRARKPKPRTESTESKTED